VRAREDATQDLLRRRHRLSKFLLRHGHRSRQGQNWTQRHWAFIPSIHFDDVHAQAVLEEYVLAIAEQAEPVTPYQLRSRVTAAARSSHRRYKAVAHQTAAHPGRCAISTPSPSGEWTKKPVITTVYTR
jgi:hypothetical protein